MKKNTNQKSKASCIEKKTKEKFDIEPVAYETQYYDYENVEDEQSESDISELESDFSDKNDQDTILREVEEMNNKYSFIRKKKTKHKKEKCVSKDELKEEEYIQ